MYSQMIIVKPTLVNPSIIISEDVFPKLHRLFVNNNCQFGLSFPDYSFKKHGSLGNRIEVLCKRREALHDLNLCSVFENVEAIKVLSDIKETNIYLTFRRVREKNRFEKRVDRFMMRGNEDPGNMRAYIHRHNKNVFSHAYITVKSSSTGQKYNIFIAPVEEENHDCDVEFNSYGLVKNC